VKLPRQCQCGQVFTPEEWLKLEFVGHQDDGDGGWLILRNCRDCHSTISCQAETPAEREASRRATVESIEVWRRVMAGWERLGMARAARGAFERIKDLEQKLEGWQ
jgi:hypothetical protein